MVNIVDIPEAVWVERTVRALALVFPNTDTPAGWQRHGERCRQLLPHALECARLIEHWDVVCPEAASLLHNTGTALRRLGQPIQAEALLLRSLAMRALLRDGEDCLSADTTSR